MRNFAIWIDCLDACCVSDSKRYSHSLLDNLGPFTAASWWQVEPETPHLVFSQGNQQPAWRKEITPQIDRFL